MLKALIIGADAVCPDYIFEHTERYPNLAKLIRQGASAAYSAYVQKGYSDSYLSEMNWSSIYTGLAPWEHQIAVKDDTGHRRTPCMKQFKQLSPFWEVLNKNGLSVGMWAADCCLEPEDINGYVVSAEYEMLDSPQKERTGRRILKVCGKDAELLSYIEGNVPPRLYPQTLEQQGYTFRELCQSTERAWRAVEAYHFKESLQNFEEELDFFYHAMCDIQKVKPVDVLYFYTPTTDLIGHCAMYCDDCDVLVHAYQLLDQYVGMCMEMLRPENTVVLSDHGMINFKELVNCSDEKIRREAFGARDEVIWLPNGYIAFEARNGALLFTAHGLKGTFIAAGKDIQTVRLDEMRTLDIYPTLLEMLGVTVPQGRSGYVQNIFERSLVNEDKKIQEALITYRTAAVLQCGSPEMTDIILNELYVQYRFVRFVVIGEARYEEIFLSNPRVSGFVLTENFNFCHFDQVYCGIYNEQTGMLCHVLVFDKGENEK